MGSSPIIRTIFTMNLENQIINYLDKVVEDHPEISPHIIQTILEDTPKQRLRPSRIFRSFQQTASPIRISNDG